MFVARSQSQASSKACFLFIGGYENENYTPIGWVVLTVLNSIHSSFGKKNAAYDGTNSNQVLVGEFESGLSLTTEQRHSDGALKP